MPIEPPESLRTLLHHTLGDLLTNNPAATSSESYVQHHVEFALLEAPVDPRYLIRIGINYHGAKVQHLRLRADGTLIGWNPEGEALGTGPRAKMLLAGYSIFDRALGEQVMTDCKIGGGDIPENLFVRAEFKVRGWLGKTKNLDGAQLEKDLDLLRDDRADLLVVALSEVAHLKWRGEGPLHHVERRTGVDRFRQILVNPADLDGTDVLVRTFTFEGQTWNTSTQRVVGGAASSMPGAEHFVTLCWRT